MGGGHKEEVVMTEIDISLEKLLEVGAHFGHQTRRWNPKMAPFIYGEKQGVHIFDLVKTRQALLEALSAIQEAVKKGKIILFVGTKKQVKEKLQKVAEQTGYPYVTNRWLGGTLTNFDQLQKSIKKLAELKEKMQKGEYNQLTKRERLLKTRLIKKLEDKFGGISKLTKLPDLLIIIDTHKESGALTEALKKKIPVVGVVDSNADPTKVTWPIPMNDDATKALDFVLSLIEQAITDARKGKKFKSKK